MNFKTIAVITSIVCLVLGLGYLFVGGFVVGRWEIEVTDSLLLLGRRMGAMFLGFAAIFFFARSVTVSVARALLCRGALVTVILLTLLGLYEFFAGHAGAGILVNVVIETLLAVGYIWILVSERRAATAG